MSESQKRANYFDLKRDETMALNEYLQSPIADRDLKSSPAPSKRKTGSVSLKKPKHIMELPTNVPRLKKGAGMVELSDGGKYFPGGKRISEFGAPDVGKPGVINDINQERINKFKSNMKDIKPNNKQSSMKIKEAMNPQDRREKDLKKFREEKDKSFLGLGIGMKNKHPKDINKKTPYKNMDLLGNQKKKKISV